LIHFSDDNNHEAIEIIPAQPKILSTKISENNSGDKATIAILSQNPDDDLEKGTLTIFDYNLKTKILSSQSYGIKDEDLNSKTGYLTSQMKVSKN
jgi:hypothetical protein